jgi:hypothetical protein
LRRIRSACCARAGSGQAAAAPPRSLMKSHRLGLAALKRITAQVVAVQFNEVEGIEEYLIVRAVVTNEIERGNAVVIAGDRLAIDDAGSRAQSRHGFDNTLV